MTKSADEQRWASPEDHLSHLVHRLLVSMDTAASIGTWDCVVEYRLPLSARPSGHCLAPHVSVHYHARHGSDQWPAYPIAAGGS